MTQATPEKSTEALRQLRQKISQAISLLENASKQLHTATNDDYLMAEMPIEMQSAIECSDESLSDVLHLLKSSIARETARPAPSRPGPTYQQGQFLAFIREFTMRNPFGAAPSHADLQRFFGLTPPSVNSMLIRLEKRGFIRRIPGKARAIEITLASDSIPPLARRLKT